MWYIPKIVVLCTKLFNMHIAPFLLWKEVEYQIWSSQACKGFMLPLPCSWCYEWYHIVFLYWICIECMSYEPLWKMYLHGNKHFLNLNLNVRLSICPSVDRIMSALYLQQYSSDPFHILYILSSNFRRCVACNVCFKIWNFGKFFKFVTLTLSSSDLGIKYDSIEWVIMRLGGGGIPQNAGVLVILVVNEKMFFWLNFIGFCS